MKKVFTLFVAVLLTATIWAQSPDKMSYQAVIRDSNLELVSNTAIGMQISILQGSASGTSVYVEIQTPTTNDNGLASIEIGAGTVQSGDFSAINWEDGPYFIKTETDPDGGTAYSITGTSQLLSVPFALHANEVDPSVPQGTGSGEMQYWNGTEWTLVASGNEGDIMTFVNNTPTWVGDTIGFQMPGEFTATAATNIIEDRFDANWTISEGATTYHLDVNTSDDFTGTWIYNNHDVGGYITSYTVSGLTCGTSYSYRLRASNSYGTTVSTNVITLETIACGGSFGTIENPTTGKTWIDRNLGASQVATSSTDANAYGDLYQWGRAADGHQIRTSDTTSTQSSNDDPGHGNFIMNGSFPFDWRNPQNDNLWQGVSGINNPCPSGFRLPTEAEWQAERASWSSNNAAGAFASVLKLPLAGTRRNSNASLDDVSIYGNYWSSTIVTTSSRYLHFSDIGASTYSNMRARGFSVRCIKD
ncbi:MAG: FISUMP domain-containing protein [Bacteroidales bacterium]|nr:FISUMP domain-containing protein [Bacteroidales bacterium]